MESLLFDLDEPEEGGICIDIYPILIKNNDPNVPTSR